MKKDKDFLKSNHVFSGMPRKLKEEGKDLPEGTQSVSYEDWQGLEKSNALSPHTPVQNLVFINMLLLFAERGRKRDWLH